MRRVVVVGFGAAGLTVCQELRARRWTGQLTVLSAEAVAPYDRPPLAKGFLTGAVTSDQVRLASDDVLAGLDLDVRYGARAVALDLPGRTVTDSAGEQHAYDALVVATGVRPRTLGWAPASGIHVLRTRDDAERLRAALAHDRTLVVVGGGFLGFEVAASARALGARVTVVEPLVEPLRDRLGPQVAGRLVALHREHGVEVRSATSVSDVVPASEDGYPHVLLTNGERLAADAVLVSVGATPDTDWLSGSGLTVADGVVCDAHCRAAEHVWAAGDVARWHHAALGRNVRIEHRMHATEQGRAVAASILGDDRPFTPVPFVWTDHYDVRIQLAGDPSADIEPTTYVGCADGPSFAVEWRGTRLSAVAGWNAARALMPARRELAAVWATPPEVGP